MTEKQYLAVCEQACRNIYNKLEILELYAEPSVSDYRNFHNQVKKQIDAYRDALESHLRQVRESDA